LYNPYLAVICRIQPSSNKLSRLIATATTNNLKREKEIELTKQKCNQNFRAERGANLAEFGPALIILFVIIFVPMVNLIAWGWGIAAAIFITNQSAKAAAVSENYDMAISSATSTAVNLSNSYLGRLARLKPVEGFNNSGLDLYIVATNILTNRVCIFGPDVALSGTIDTTNNVYEYQVQTTYEVAPLFNLGKAPMLDNIPIISKPTMLSFTAQQSAEYPNGLTGGAGVAGVPAAPKMKIWNAPDSNNPNGSFQSTHYITSRTEDNTVNIGYLKCHYF
jgi:hypothetical protein